MSEHKDQPELTNNDYAVFETNGDDWCQLSVWTTKEVADQFYESLKPDGDSTPYVLKRM